MSHVHWNQSVKMQCNEKNMDCNRSRKNPSISLLFPHMLYLTQIYNLSKPVRLCFLSPTGFCVDMFDNYTKTLKATNQCRLCNITSAILWLPRLINKIQCYLTVDVMLEIFCLTAPIFSVHRFYFFDSFLTFLFRPYEDRLCTLLLLLQLMVGESRLYGGPVRDARLQRYGTLSHE